MGITTPPIPREHGAWMMLYLPLVVALFIFHPVPVGPAVLIGLAVTGAFFAQHVVGLWLRRRSTAAAFWLAAYGLLAAAAGAGLVLAYGFTELVWLGIPALILFAWQIMLRRTARKRLNHSHLSEFAAIAVFTLSIPAVALAARGSFVTASWWVWGGCILYFGSSVFYVRMLVEAARSKSAPTAGDRWRLGGGLLVYHTLMAGAGLFLYLTSEVSWPILLAYAPALARALWAWLRLSNLLPSLKRIGVGEILYSLWFAFWLIVGV